MPHKIVVLAVAFGFCLFTALAEDSSTWIAIDARKAGERIGSKYTVDCMQLKYTNGWNGISLNRDDSRPGWHFPIGTWRYQATPITGCEYEENHELTFKNGTVSYIGVVLVPAPIRNVPYYASWYSNDWSRFCFGSYTNTDANTVRLRFDSSMTIRKCSGTYTNLDAETIRFTINGELLHYDHRRTKR